MTTLALTHSDLIDTPPAVRFGWRRTLSFRLFLLTTIILFLRPTEFFAAGVGPPLYELCILASLMLAAPELVEQLTPRSLRNTPIALCVALLVLATTFSHLSHLAIGQAARSTLAVARIVLYFLLMLAVIQTPEQLLRFIRVLAWLILVLALLSVLGFHGIVSSPAVEPMAQPYSDAWGDTVSVHRLRGPGIFHDPNDMCLILVPGIMLWIHKLTSTRRYWFTAIVPLVAIAICFSALILTRSRGGFIVLLAAILGFMAIKLGLRRMIPWLALLLPLLLFLFAGRQTNIDLTDQDDTAQSRIQLWSEGLDMFRRAPLFGVGQGTYADEAGYVAHNSFVHSYAELGFFGGTLFLGAWYLAIRGLRRVELSNLAHADLFNLRPCLMGCMCGYIAGMLSLSRSYVVPTYLMLALVALYLRLVSYDTRPMQLSTKLILRVMGASVVALLVIYLFVRFTARWSS